MIILSVLALSYWLWFGIEERSIIEDEGLSILSALSILDHGYPLLPSGYLYHRAYIPHYIIAASIVLFGLNNFSIMFPSLLAATGVLWLIFFYSKNILDHRWLGVATVVLLFFLQKQTFFATGPRMYIFYEFFFLASIYWAYIGYTGGKEKFQWLSALGICAAILSHREGLVLLFVIPFSLLAVSFLTEKKLMFKKNFLSFIPLSPVASVFFFVYVFKPKNMLMPITAHGGFPIVMTGTNQNIFRIFKNFFQLDHLLPLALLFIPLILYQGIKSLQREKNGLFYSVSIFAASLLSVSLYLKHIQDRFWFFILPLYSLLVCFCVRDIIISFAGPRDKRDRHEFLNRKAVVSLILVGGLFYLGANLGLHFIQGRDLFFPQLKAGYGLPCRDEHCRKTIKDDYDHITSFIDSEDSIISSNPLVTYYYLGRVHGFLREKIVGEGAFSSFLNPDDEYFGIPLMDSTSELKSALEKDRRVWIVTDYKIKDYSSRQTKDFIASNYRLFYQGESVSFYVNH